MRNKHPEGSVWPKLLSVLDPKLIPDTSRGDHFSDDVTVCQDSEEHYVFHFKKIPTSIITEQRPFSEMRENKCTEGIETLEKIKLKLKNVPADILSTELNEACAEIRDLWHYFLEISVLDFRVVILPLVISFIWERFLLCMMEDKKAASESVDAADIDAVFPYVDDTPDIDEIFPNVDGALESNDAICPVPGASDSSAANIDAIRPNVVDASNSNAANTDAVCHSTADAPDSNAADIDAVCPNVGDAPENNAADTDAIIPNIADATENNAADTDAIIPNIADTPDRNSATKDGSNLYHANKLSYSDDTATDGGDKESEVHVKDENYGATVNEKESSPPTEMVEYGSELDATPGNMEADLKYDSPNQTSLPSLSDQIYSTAKTASHLLGKFDQSTEEIASISCYRNSIDVLKKNNADEDLYFLNVIIQLLWNLRHFRNEFLRRRSAFDIAHEDLCIAEKLYKIFSAWEKNEHSKMVLLLTDVKTTLCGIVNDSNMFQTLQVGRNFASEIMAIILQGLHKFDNSMYVGSMRMVIDAPCKYCVWYTLGLFGIRLKQLMSCRCGEWFGEECILFFHKLDASSPHSTKINCFEELSVLMNSQSNCERRCTNCSGSVKQIGCFLSKGPHFFTIVLKDWLGSDESQAILSEALFGIASPLDITLLYKGVTLRHIGGHSATKYRLASVICYIEHGYVCFARDQDKWLKYDTTTVKTVDSWGELLELYREINLQPEVLVYEVIK
ncbi:hypothetical protein E2562_022363 [Oryza meyeriana var. granulata]|uniref:USP domain-containing protein n=1 Tax=Oryza meyeriana var. granulata TaxID=110450 RepID=A0A6G1DM38_9ORYZ|nr:hypothetical protein E2562_022363 [Oryza meyeriana var. granulata]